MLKVTNFLFVIILILCYHYVVVSYAYNCTVGDELTNNDAYTLCSSDPVCSRIFQLDAGGTGNTLWRFLIINNNGTALDSKWCMLQHFEFNMTDTEKANYLAINTMIRIGTEMPPCPYDMVYVIDDLTGGSSCVCPMGVACRPACNDRTIWTTMCIACVAVLAVCLALRVIFVPSIVVSRESKRDR